MSDSNEKVSTLDFEKAAMSENQEYERIEWRGITVIVRHAITLPYMIKFVEYVVESCFDSDTGEYIPEIKDFAFRSGLVQFYTNVALPNDAEKQYKLLYGNSFFDSIFNSGIIDNGQLNSIIGGINRKLKYLTNSDINRLKCEFDNVAKSLSDFSQGFSDVFQGVDNDSLGKIVDAIADGGFDEAKLVKAFTDAKLIDQPDTQDDIDNIDNMDNLER